MTKPTKRQSAIGPLSPRSEAKVAHFIPEPQDFPEPTKVANSTQRETFKGTVWNIRQGGLDHLRFKSRGYGC